MFTQLFLLISRNNIKTITADLYRKGQRELIMYINIDIKKSVFLKKCNLLRRRIVYTGEISMEKLFIPGLVIE